MARDPYLVTGEAARTAIDRAAAAGVPRVELAVLLAVLRFTTTYSRLADRRTLAQLAAAAGITGKDAHDVDRRVSRALRHLAQIGAVTYEPGLGKTMSLVGLPDIERGSIHTPSEPCERGSIHTPSEGVESERQRGSDRNARGGGFAPPTRGSYARTYASGGKPPDPLAQTRAADAERADRYAAQKTNPCPTCDTVGQIPGPGGWALCPTCAGSGHQ